MGGTGVGGWVLAWRPARSVRYCGHDCPSWDQGRATTTTTLAWSWTSLKRQGTSLVRQGASLIRQGTSPEIGSAPRWERPTTTTTTTLGAPHDHDYAGSAVEGALHPCTPAPQPIKRRTLNPEP